MEEDLKPQKPTAKKPRDMTPEEKAARVRHQNRMYYLRNRHWMLEERRQQREEARRRRRRRRKPVKPQPSAEELQKAKEARLEAAEKRRQQRLREREEWNELGWVVAKMNVTAGLSQDAIHQLLGGLASKRKIAAWCQRGRKLARIEPTK